jgi:hypothetical protein
LTVETIIRIFNPSKQNNEQVSEMKTIDLGNNESISSGVFKNSDGTFTALTFSKSKSFKTKAGAERWLARNS